jgi:hypothetical protein
MLYVSVISCPVCAGPVQLVEGQPRCPLAHAFDQDELPVRVREEATKALWSAVRALEDTASAARWRLSQPNPAPYLQGVIDKATGEVVILRDVLWRWREQDDATEAAEAGLRVPLQTVPRLRVTDAAAHGEANTDALTDHDHLWRRVDKHQDGVFDEYRCDVCHMEWSLSTQQ